MISPTRSNRLHALRATLGRSQLPGERADALLLLAELILEFNEARAQQIERLGAGLSAEHHILRGELNTLNAKLDDLQRAVKRLS